MQRKIFYYEQESRKSIYFFILKYLFIFTFQNETLQSPFPKKEYNKYELKEQGLCRWTCRGINSKIGNENLLDLIFFLPFVSLKKIIFFRDLFEN